MTEFTACHTGAQAVVANADRIVLEAVGKIIPAFGHGSNENANTLFRCQIRNIVSHTYNLGIEAQCDLSAIGREMVSDGVLDDLEQLLLRIGGANGKSVQELDHQSGESFEGTWYADRWADFDKDALGRVDVNLQPSSFVDRGVEQCEEALR